MKKVAKTLHLGTKIALRQGEKGLAKNNKNAGNYKSFDVDTVGD